MMLSSEIIQQIRKIQIKAGHLVTDALAGEYISAFKGVGQEFEKVREYIPGDDIRSIDWNVTARMNAPFVKVFQEERELTLMIMVDVSASQNFGTSGQFKREAAAELAAVLAFLAIKNNDKVGLIVFSDHVEQYIPPQKGRSHVWRIIRAVLTHEGHGIRTDIDGALKYLLQVCKRKSMCFLLSDFCADGYDKRLRIASKRHDLVCAVVKDQQEMELPKSGLIQLQDAETGESVLLDSNHATVRKIFKENYDKQSQALYGMFQKNGIDYLDVSTSESVVNPITRYLRQRERRLIR